MPVLSRPSRNPHAMSAPFLKAIMDLSGDPTAPGLMDAQFPQGTMVQVVLRQGSLPFVDAWFDLGEMSLFDVNEALTQGRGLNYCGNKRCPGDPRGRYYYELPQGDWQRFEVVLTTRDALKRRGQGWPQTTLQAKVSDRRAQWVTAQA